MTGPLALMTWCHATGGLDWEHWPVLLRAATPRVLSGASLAYAVLADPT